MKKHRVIMIEDEDNLRGYLKNILQVRYPEIDIVGEAASTEQALDLLNQLQIDGAFMDIHLGNHPTAGVDLAVRLKQLHKLAWIIFITGSPHHAIDVINQVQPDGYLLKPVDTEKLHSTVFYVLYERGNRLPVISSFVHEPSIEIGYKITKANGEKEKAFIFIKPSAILYFRKNKNSNSIYIKLLDGRELNDVIGTLESWQEKLNQPYFYQIHRSCFVNLQQAQSILHPQKETYQLTFKCTDDRLTIGESFYTSLIEKMSA